MYSLKINKSALKETYLHCIFMYELSSAACRQFL